MNIEIIIFRDFSYINKENNWTFEIIDEETQNTLYECSACYSKGKCIEMAAEHVRNYPMSNINVCVI